MATWAKGVEAGGCVPTMGKPAGKWLACPHWLVGHHLSDLRGSFFRWPGPIHLRHLGSLPLRRGARLAEERAGGQPGIRRRVPRSGVLLLEIPTQIRALVLDITGRGFKQTSFEQ